MTTSKNYWKRVVVENGKVMENLKLLCSYINCVASDCRLKPSHISLYLALCHSWIMSQFQVTYNVSRKRLMTKSRIKSKSTYHKIIKELEELGYVKYFPSYHPVKGSTIRLLSPCMTIEDLSFKHSKQDVAKVMTDLG